MDYESFLKRIPELRVVMEHSDLNAWGKVHGGVIMTHIDTAGARLALAISNQVIVTCKLECQFLEPVSLGDCLSFYADLVKIGRTSITLEVTAIAERFDPIKCEGSKHCAAKATVIYVAVDKEGHPVEIVDHRA